MARRAGPEELELSAEEAARLAEAFRDERFRSLFAEYAAELADPAQRALYEAEVAALERERGVLARFLHPTPGWVLRTSQAGQRRCYVNICSHPLVGRPEREPGPGAGCTWRLPHCLAPPREELRRPPRPRRLLYDVLFHPEALRLAARAPRLRRLLQDTALDALDAHFQAGLDRANAAPLRSPRYKGTPQATLLRTPLPGGPPGPEEEEGASPLPPLPTPYAYPPPAPQTRPAPAAAPAATTPRWSLRQRSYVDLQDFRCSRDSAPSPVPRELEVSVELPLLASAAQARLEVRGRELRLDSERPAAAYRLRLPLPYAVDEARGRATFDKAARRLLVTLPVLPPPARAELPAPGPPPPGAHEPAEASPPPRRHAPGPEAPPGPGGGSVELAGPPEDLAAEPPLQPGSSRPASPAPPGDEDPPAPAPVTERAPEAAAGSRSHVDLPARGPEEPGDPAPALCPPFRCTQDAEALRLLLLVPGILPQSLRGQVGAQHYRVRFRSGDSAAYSLLLQFPPGQRLSPPETQVSVSPRNALVGLAKAPEARGPWAKMRFGVDGGDSEERWFLTEDNVDGFLDSLAAASCSSQSTVEHQPLVEVLDVSEGKSQIRLKREEQLSFEPGETEEMANPRKTDSNQESGSEHPMKADDSPLQTSRASGSLTAGETMGSPGWESGHCLELNPSGPEDEDVFIPGKSLISKLSHESELACTSSKEATATTQAQLNGGEPAETGEGEEGHSQSAENHGGSEGRPVPPVLKETDMRDGSVQLVCQHTTHCPVTFQNSLLYELD
ncbi:protein kintoun [Tiliqua scincoides]|uniref:protein kintoun n=1 Tax=Tiliqua scincoides TaxID=71010 RepID=UPI0034617E12